MLVWGQKWFGDHLAGQPWGKAALIRVLGSIIIAAACCAAGFAVVDSPPSRRNGSFWFATGHAVVLLVVLSQQIAIWVPGLAETAAQLLLFVTCALFYLWSTSEGEHAPLPRISLFGDAAPASTERLRSQYEQQIREATRLEERNRLARDLQDLLMPGGIDGIESTRCILQYAPTTKVIALTASTDEARMMGVLRAGAVGYVRKDAEPEVLLAAVRAVARGKTYIDPSVSRQMLQATATRDDLTAREIEVLRQLALGRSNKEIADALSISDETVKTHVSHVFSKLQVENRSQAIVQALKRGLVSLDELK
jgi:NarL family two-component system response regulator LiaR